MAFALLCLAVAAEAFPATVIGVTDGDTITVLHDGHPEVLRLNGIDAPESGQAFGSRAKQFTAQLAFGQPVEVDVRDVDRYTRTVADVRLPDWRSLNDELVRAATRVVPAVLAPRDARGGRGPGASGRARALGGRAPLATLGVAPRHRDPTERRWS